MPQGPRSHPRPRLRPSRLWLSLAFTFAAALPVALFLTGTVRRSMFLSQLDGAPAQRERALNYVLRESSADPTLTRAVVERFDTLDPEAVLQAYAALTRSPRPGQGLASDRLIHNLHRFDHATFVQAFNLLDASGCGRDPTLLREAAQRLTRAAPPEADTLRELLTRQGAWSTPPVPAPVYLDWVARRGADAQPALRRHAAGLLATLPASVFGDPDAAQRAQHLLEMLAGDPQPTVRRAALAAAAALHAIDPAAARIPRHLQTDPDPAVRAAAADIVDLLARRALPESTIPRPPTELDAVTDANRLAVWRNLVLAPESPASRRVRDQIADAPVGDDQPNTPLIYAAAARRGWVDPALLSRAHAQSLPEAEWPRLLAELEGAAPGSVALDTLPASTPHLLRPAAARAARQPRPAWLRPVFRLDDRPALRANACLVAAQRFDDATLQHLIDTLLADEDPEARISGALIAGLRGERANALRRLAVEDPQPAVRQFARLAQWMQHDLPQLEGTAAERLGHPDLPEPLVMLALLHRGAWGPVLDRLFDPVATPPAQRRALLGPKRFAIVLGYHLPTDAPPLHLWADGDQFARELDALSAWAAVNRRRGNGKPPAGGGLRHVNAF